MTPMMDPWNTLSRVGSTWLRTGVTSVHIALQFPVPEEATRRCWVVLMRRNIKASLETAELALAKEEKKHSSSPKRNYSRNRIRSHIFISKPIKYLRLMNDARFNFKQNIVYNFEKVSTARMMPNVIGPRYTSRFLRLVNFIMLNVIPVLVTALHI